MRTPEPRMFPQTNSTSSIYKQLHKHKRLHAGIGLRFNNGTQQRDDAIHESEEGQAYEADEIREDKEESVAESEECEASGGSQEEDSEYQEDSP